MAITLSVFLAQVDGQIEADNDIFDDLERYRAIRSAVETYSGDRPDTYTEDVTGDGGRYYAMSNLTYWSEGFSGIEQIEYPAAAIASDETPVYLEREDWQDDYWAEVSGTHTRHLYLKNHAPASTETMRITYTVPWLWTAASATTAVAQTAHGFSVSDYCYEDSSGDYQKATSQQIATHQVSAVADADNCTVKILQTTIPVDDFFAVCNLASAVCCFDIAAKMAKQGQSTINADSVDHRSKSDQFQSRGERFLKLYREHLGLDADKEEGAAGEFVDMDSVPGWPSGRDYLFHGRGLR
jgi:hypothetical protein